MDDDLRDTEGRAFRAAFDTGLWDVMMAAVVSMFAIAPLLSGRLGDIWAAAVFAPIRVALDLYGGLLVVAGAVGGILFQRGLASHHGYPVGFGSSAVLIALIGLVRFAKYLPPRVDGPSATVSGARHD